MSDKPEIKQSTAAEFLAGFTFSPIFRLWDMTVDEVVEARKRKRTPRKLIAVYKVGADVLPTSDELARLGGAGIAVMSVPHSASGPKATDADLLAYVRRTLISVNMRIRDVAESTVPTRRDRQELLGNFYGKDL